VLYEGSGPSGTLFLVEGMTDNRNRTVAEIRKIFEKHNGVLGGGGAAAWAFDKKGVIQIPKVNATEDQLMELAVGAGAEDYNDSGDEWQVTTPADRLTVILEALEKGKIPGGKGNLAFLPKNRKPVAGRDAEVALDLVETLDDHDDVQNVYANFDVSDEELARIARLQG
jgi:transcriptional/translational regulatory protein YebC/TACO1